MDKKNLIPQAAKPVVRVTQGTSPQLAELSEEVLSGTQGVTPSFDRYGEVTSFCSMDDDAE
jgi:bacteriocin leader peptide (microcyclamide/patellamide family)